MAKINISELNPAGVSLFGEGFMQELSENELDAINGGRVKICIGWSFLSVEF
jgi:bacteriocin-like protein